MLRLTRLNHHVIAINPDHIAWAEEMPDTTLALLGGEKIIVRESLGELIERIVVYRRRIRALGIRTSQDPDDDENPTCYAQLGDHAAPDGDVPAVSPLQRRSAVLTRDEGRPSRLPGDR
jgi:flagellar protein FlbD